MFACLLALCAMTIQMTNACYNVAQCPFAKFTCTRGNPRNSTLGVFAEGENPKIPKNTKLEEPITISFEAEVSLKRLTFTAFTLGNGEGPGCKVDTFPAEGKDGDMAFVRMTTGFGEGQVDCGIEETNGELLGISVWVSGTFLGIGFELHFNFRGHNFGGPDRTYLAEIVDPNGVVECLCENGGTCVRDEKKATIDCICPKPYTGRYCTEPRIPCRNPAKGIDGQRIFCGRGPNRQNCPRGYECKTSPTDIWAVCCPSKGRDQYKHCHDNSGCGFDCKLEGCKTEVRGISETEYLCNCNYRDGNMAQACTRPCIGMVGDRDCGCKGCDCVCSDPKSTPAE